MPTRKKDPALSVAQKSTELVIAAPQVVAHRLTRMAIAGPALSRRDQEEFSGMITEKGTAFSQSWTAMMLESMHASQAIGLALFKAFLNPWGEKWVTLALFGQMQKAALSVVEKGIDPVHSKAVANARRLSGTPL